MSPLPQRADHPHGRLQEEGLEEGRRDARVLAHDVDWTRKDRNVGLVGSLAGVRACELRDDDDDVRLRKSLPAT